MKKRETGDVRRSPEGALFSLGPDGREGVGDDGNKEVDEPEVEDDDPNDEEDARNEEL